MGVTGGAAGSRPDRGLLTAVVVTAALGLVACGAPAGLEAVGAEGISFSRPTGWEEVEDLARDGTIGRQAWVSPSTGASTGLFVDVFCAGDVPTVVEGFLAQNRSDDPSFEVVRRREPDVPGSEDATVLETTYEQRRGDGPPSADDPVRLTRFDVIAGADGVAVRLSVVGAADSLDRDLARRVITSLRLSPSDDLVTTCRDPDAGRTAPPG